MSIYDYSATNINGKEVSLADYKGQVVLIVNTASKCAYTDQYEGLEELYERYRDRGLVVLGFPSNDYGGQEPGTEKQIKTFCRLTYSVKFPMFEKTHAREDVADPLYLKPLAHNAHKLRHVFALSAPVLNHKPAMHSSHANSADTDTVLRHTRHDVIFHDVTKIQFLERATESSTNPIFDSMLALARRAKTANSANQRISFCRQ